MNSMDTAVVAADEETLSLLETSSESAESHVAPPDGITNPRKRRAMQQNQNVSRERRKHELEFLRQHVVELESELNTLQRRRDELLRPHLAGSTGKLVTTAPVWEDMAKRQFQARRKAETETTQLKTVLAAQAQVAQDLIRIIERARGIGQDTSVLRAIDPPPVDSDNVNDQLDRLRILCAQWFVAFSWYSELQTGPLRFFESKVVSDDGVETVIDIYSSQSFPFPIPDVEDAIWTMYQADWVDNDSAFTQNCQATDDTLVSKFTAATARDRLAGCIKGTYVTRRFRNEQGHFLMATNIAATSDIPNCDDTFAIMEDTWIRILDAKELSGVIAMTESTPTLTVLQHVRRARIRFVNPDRPGPSRMQLLLDLHLKFVEQEMRWGQQNIESMLMRRASTLG